MLANDATTSNNLQWKVAIFCAAAILVGHFLEEARGYGWTSSIFPKHWVTIYEIADTSVAIAFAILTCLVVWFSRKHLTPFFVAPILGLLNWGENELKSRAFFGGFLKTIDWWQWAAIDAELAVLVAIFLKPVIHKIAPRESGAMRLSIADLFLATLASAVLIVATRSIATLPASPDNPNVLFCGWPQTLIACLTGILIGCVAAAAVYLAIASTWKRGLLTYVCVCVVYFGVSRSVVINNGTVSLKSWQIPDWTLSAFGPLIVVFSLFAAAMIALRYWCGRLPTIEKQATQIQE